jgi:hypothetical protein
MAAPTITSFSVDDGPTIGGTSVTATGTGFTGTSSITVGGAAATGVTVNSSTSVTFVTPARSVGIKNIILTTPNGSVTKTNAFTYVDKYYYANVKRYQDPEGRLEAQYIMKTPRIRDANHRTNTTFYVYYLIEVYATTIRTFSTWVATGADGTFAGQLVSPNSGTNENNGLANGLTTSITVNQNAGANQSQFVTTGKPSNDNSRFKVSFKRNPGATNTVVTAKPTAAIQWKSDASPNWTNIPNNRINWGTPNNAVPSITWTTVVTPPVFPKEAIKAVIKELYNGAILVEQKNEVLAQNQITLLSNYQWDKCTKLWNFVINYKTPQFGGEGYQAHWTCTKNGDICQQKSPKPTANDLSTKTKLAAWTKKYVTKPMIDAKSNAACGETSSGSGKGLKDITTVTPPKGDTRWNPPPHRDARGTSYGERVNYGAKDAFNTVSAFSQKERGRIYQDANGAAVLNKSAQGLKDAVASKVALNQWGFRFMYNPTTFGYSSSSNNSVDWTLGAADPAVLLTGNSAVSFEVYINRIPDLKYLRLKNPKVSEAQLYGRNLTQVEKEGILNRGTEYDIEFLYRVLNGDPLSKSLLLNYNGVTADFGYTTGVPCWLVLNENLRYFGSVASFQVNHAMFDLNMVPMLSTVSITFARYPALWNQTAAFGKAVTVENIKENLATTPKG